MQNTLSNFIGGRLTVCVPKSIKYVAVFLIAFALFDVCTPEPCYAQVAPTTNVVNVLSEASQNNSTGDSCQFEEDCFNCAHYAPGTSFVPEAIAVIAFTQPDLFAPSLDGSAIFPYHPPRA